MDRRAKVELFEQIRREYRQGAGTIQVGIHFELGPSASNGEGNGDWLELATLAAGPG
ncbi:MAG: hypothetical protein JO307_33605 [Bryobacterales bacterium]|nr:hypothetical protein [Bryobacterales bacterium]